MPLAVEALTTDSTLKETRDAIDLSMSQCMREGGRTQEECAGMVYGIARRKTPHALDEGRQQ